MHVRGIAEEGLVLSMDLCKRGGREESSEDKKKQEEWCRGKNPTIPSLSR
jgi:hypothetical protein